MTTQHLHNNKLRDNSASFVYATFTENKSWAIGLRSIVAV